MSSIKVKNTGPKTIGLGSLIVNPGENASLPEGFGTDHPTVKFFFARGWLERVTESGIVIPTNMQINEIDEIVIPTNMQINEIDKSDEEDIKKDGNKNDSSDNDKPLELSRRDIERLNLEGLRELATKRNLEFASNATRSTLIELIFAHMSEKEAVEQE